MELIEHLSCRTTPPSKKKRKEPGYRLVDEKRYPGLQQAIEKCLGTGREQQVKDGFMTYYFVKMTQAHKDVTEEQCKRDGLPYVMRKGKIFLPHVSEYSLLFTFGVKR